MTLNTRPFQTQLSLAPGSHPTPKQQPRGVYVELTTADFVDLPQNVTNIPMPETMHDNGATAMWVAGNLDFNTGFYVKVPLAQLMAQANVDQLQTVYVDNSMNWAGGLALLFDSGFQLNCPPLTQGLYPIINGQAPNVTIVNADRTAWESFQLTAASNAPVVTRLFFMDVMLPYSQWKTRSTFGRGWHDASGATVAVAPATITALGVNPMRQALMISNPPTANEPLYWSYGSPTLGIDSMFSLAPGATFYDKGEPMPHISVRFSAATIGHKFVCKELW